MSYKMKILWIISGIVPAIQRKLQCGEQVTCGWIPSMLEAVAMERKDIDWCVFSMSSEAFDFVENNVRYVSFGLPSLKGAYTSIPDYVEDRAAKVINDFNPDVIHIHGTEYFYGCMSQRVYGNRPVVVSLQGIISGCFPHYSGAICPGELWFEKFIPRGLLHHNTIYGVQTYWQNVRARQEERVMRQQKYFIGRTDWDRNWVRYYNSTAKYYQVNESLRPPFYGKMRDSSKVVKHQIYCGNAAGYPLKGVHWLLRAINSLKGDYPDIRLRIANSQSRFTKMSLLNLVKAKAYTIYLRRLVSSMKLEDHIVALPPLTAKEVADELERAEIFVLPSLCENSPNSLGEAMMVGTPSIATYVGGVPSILRNGVDGVLVPSADPAALSGAIRSWFKQPEMARDCAARAKEVADVRHDAKRNALAMIAVYADIVGRQSNR